MSQHNLNPEFSEDDLILLAEEEYDEISYREAAPDIETPNGHVGEKVVSGFLGFGFVGLAALLGGSVGFVIAAIVAAIVWGTTRP